jgi:hypothetical protein
LFCYALIKQKALRPFLASGIFSSFSYCVITVKMLVFIKLFGNGQLATGFCCQKALGYPLLALG